MPGQIQRYFAIIPDAAVILMIAPRRFNFDSSPFISDAEALAIGPGATI